mgnify:CR=1 FL=1|tara:strand:+ start:2152 stop:2379 length:228 start_codon:yes stop_codon:yes gene_type:complete
MENTLSQKNTDTQSIYTAIGQLSYHDLDYQNYQKYIVLLELRYLQKLIDQLNNLSIQAAWYIIQGDTHQLFNINL